MPLKDVDAAAMTKQDHKGTLKSQGISLNLSSFMPMSKFSKMNHHHISIYITKTENYAWSTALPLLWSLRWRAPAPIPAAGSDCSVQGENVPLHPGAQLVLWNPDSFPGLTNAPLPADKISFLLSHFFGVERVCRDTDASHSLLLCPSGLGGAW